MSYVEEFCEDIVVINHGNVVLKGQLKDIKKEYGKNRMILACDNFNNEETKKLVNDKFGSYVKVTGETKEEIILELGAGKTKEEFMEALWREKVGVARFGNYEPSLNEIFVMNAGDEA